MDAMSSAIIPFSNNLLYQPELAVAFFQRAMEMEPSNTNVMDALAEVLMQLGDCEKSLELLTRSTTEAPSVNPFKWMYLAQLQGGEEALASYRRGVHELGAVLGSGVGSDEVSCMSNNA